MGSYKKEGDKQNQTNPDYSKIIRGKIMKLK